MKLNFKIYCEHRSGRQMSLTGLLQRLNWLKPVTPLTVGLSLIFLFKYSVFNGIPPQNILRCQNCTQDAVSYDVLLTYVLEVGVICE